MNIWILIRLAAWTFLSTLDPPDDQKPVGQRGLTGGTAATAGAGELTVQLFSEKMGGLKDLLQVSYFFIF